MSTSAGHRTLDTLDHLIIGLEAALGTALGAAAPAGRRFPGEDVDDGAMTMAERRHAAGLMRVNHAGEVAAQALYRSQGLVARGPSVRAAMDAAAREEGDHLAWCERRLSELDSRTSLLGPFWYLGAFSIGTCAGLAGDRWSLGFLAETERQVVRHLEGHLQRLPPPDHRSRAVVRQMCEDEGRHATRAVESGAREMPRLVRRLMKLGARVMTTTAYRL